LTTLMNALLGLVDAIPWLVPGIALTVVLSVFLARPVGRALGSSAVVGWLGVVSLGLIVSATLTPGAGTVDSAGVCDLSRLGLAPPRELRRVTETSLNVVLFVPAGAFVALLPHRGPRASLAIVALLLPFGIEAVQWLVPALGRGCQSADVVDNVTGTVLGFAAAYPVLGLVSRGGRRDRLRGEGSTEPRGPSREAPSE
jgi:hypothetical protein